MGASDWVQDKGKISGTPDRELRFNLAARAFAESQLRNRMPSDGGAGCPVLVEGKRDKAALRALGFEGPIELINRGWDRSRLVAYFYDTYGTRNTIDGGPPLMLLMDWDRTGGQIQTSLRDRLNSLDVPIDENLRKVLLRTMKPEGKTVEALAPFAKTLRSLIEEQRDEI